MKKMVRRHLGGIIVVGMLLSLMLNYVLQIQKSQNDMEEKSDWLFRQINQRLSENTIEAEKIKEEFQNQCLAKAESAAYMIQENPAAAGDSAELDKIVKMLQIDELHIFNAQGIIYAGSEPKYFGYSFDSGEQMEFFLPMLKDKTLKLCQPITPNTAEGKMMQYAAVWSEDGEDIIQIGMEPERVLEATEKNELSYIFSQLTAEDGADLCAADAQTYEILGATNQALLGKTLDEIGIEKEQLQSGEKAFHAVIKGKLYYCTFTRQNDILVGRACTAKSIYGQINENAALLALYLLGISIIMILGITKYLDRNIILGIDEVNRKLQSITGGNLEEIVDVSTTPEFAELSGHINGMVKSLLETTDKLSSALDMAQIPIGTYEYSYGAERVRITSKIPEILAWTEEEKEEIPANYILFESRLSEIRCNPVNSEKDIFQLPKNPERYVRMESFIRENSIFGVLMDVSKSVKERKRLEQERDEDTLTGLYSRRAFYAQMELLLGRPEHLKHNVLIMVDADNLKQINDSYGHDGGDCYLRGVAQALRSGSAPKRIVARLSGDEFALFLYGCDSEEELQTYIKELKSRQNGYDVCFHDDVYLSVKFSMGCAYYPQDGTDYHVLLKCADQRMYIEKRRKKQN